MRSPSCREETSPPKRGPLTHLLWGVTPQEGKKKRRAKDRCPDENPSGLLVGKEIQPHLTTKIVLKERRWGGEEDRVEHTNMTREEEREKRKISCCMWVGLGGGGRKRRKVGGPYSWENEKKKRVLFCSAINEKGDHSFQNERPAWKGEKLLLPAGKRGKREGSYALLWNPYSSPSVRWSTRPREKTKRNQLPFCGNRKKKNGDCDSRNGVAAIICTENLLYAKKGKKKRRPARHLGIAKRREEERLSLSEYV